MIHYDVYIYIYISVVFKQQIVFVIFHSYWSSSFEKTTSKWPSQRLLRKQDSGIDIAPEAPRILQQWTWCGPFQHKWSHIWWDHRETNGVFGWFDGPLFVRKKQNLWRSWIASSFQFFACNSHLLSLTKPYSSQSLNFVHPRGWHCLPEDGMDEDWSKPLWTTENVPKPRTTQTNRNQTYIFSHTTFDQNLFDTYTVILNTITVTNIYIYTYIYVCLYTM